MEHTPKETLVSCRYTIWYYILQLYPKGKVPFYLVGRTAFIVRYSDGTKSKVSIS